MNICRIIARIVKAVVFFTLLLACIAIASRVLMRKESLTRNSRLIEDPKAFDVLFVGNSHIVNAVLPLELWNGYGISSHILASSGNRMPVTYWMLQNAFACGVQPKLVIIDVDDVGVDNLIQENASEVHTALDAFPLTRTKAAAIEALMSNPEDCFEQGKKKIPYMNVKWEYYWVNHFFCGMSVGASSK